MPLAYDHQQKPYGGHYFDDPSGITIRHDTLRGLVKAIATYRTMNSMAKGNPEAEVETFYATKFPWLISKVGQTSELVEDPIERWLNRVWRNPPKERDFIESEPMKARLSKCHDCPHYAAIHALSPAANRQLIILGAGHVSDFGACKIQHWAVGLAVFMPVLDAAPVDGCWAESSH